MLDVVFSAVTVVFFAVTVAFAVGCDRLMGQGEGAMIENILLTIVSLAIVVYLFVALIRPEVF